MSDVALHRLGGEGRDLLLIHGFGADRLSWLAIAPQLFDLASVWAVEYAGHGAAGDNAGDGDPHTIATAIRNAIDGQLTKPHIVGHSLGGTLALHLAAMMPDDLAGLLLLAPASLASRIDTGFVGAIPELDDADAALDLLRRLVSRKTLITPRMAEAMLAGLAAPERRTALRCIATALETAATPPFPPDVPFEILWGAEDASRCRRTPPGAGSSTTGHFPISRREHGFPSQARPVTSQEAHAPETLKSGHETGALHAVKKQKPF